MTIPKGSSSSKVGSILAHDGVVSSGFFFERARAARGQAQLAAFGAFALQRDMSYSAAIDALSKPPPKAIAVKVVIPEGYTRRQIAELVREDALSGDYLAASERSRAAQPAPLRRAGGTRNLEGFLFPATRPARGRPSDAGRRTADAFAGASARRLRRAHALA